MNLKNTVSIFVGLSLLFSVGCSKKKTEFKDQKERESYSLGYQFGKNLKFQETDLDFDVYMTALRDALGGKEPRMSDEEMKATINELQKRLAETQQKVRKEQSAKNLADGKAFLEENGAKEGIVTLPSGLQYKVLAEGSGKTPKATDAVTVHYRGTLLDGTEFDSSYGRGEPQMFRVNGVIPGWSEALQLMNVGSKWQLFIPSALGYGERGIPQRIPSNSVLVFEVELISIQ